VVPPVLLILLFLGLVIAAYRDIRKREVPDTVSYGLMALGLLGGLCIALLESNPALFLDHLFGLLLGATIGVVMYYGRQWGGGDAKLVMGVGAVLGFLPDNLLFLGFLLLLIVCGALYGVAVTLWLALVRHRKRFLLAFRAIIRTPMVHRARIMLVLTGVACVIALLFVPPELRIVIGFLLIGVYLLTYAWIFSRAVEESIFIKEYPVGRLTEGDWIAQDVRVRGRVIVKKNIPGITLRQIARLRRLKVKRVWVKEGIAFVPAFLLAFLAMVLLLSTLGPSWIVALLP
jgi:Flp pilus assembly protein protease CpaA